MMNLTPDQLTASITQILNIIKGKSGDARHGADYVPESLGECFSLIIEINKTFPDFERRLNYIFVGEIFNAKHDIKTISECILKGSTIV